MLLWKEQYRIGVQQIDEQHKQLLMRLEDLLNVVKNEPENAEKECIQTIAFLKSYVMVHFNTEEMYQESIEFDDIEAHKLLHEGFNLQLRDFEFELIRRDFDTDKIEEFARSLTKWWIYHIMREDKKMVDPSMREG